MDAIKNDVVNEAFKEALDGLEEAQALNFVKSEEVGQRQTLDDAPWQPSEVLEVFPELISQKVELIGLETDLNKIHKHLLKWRNAGLVLMGPTIDRNSKPLLILLTTYRRIYAIDPEDKQRGMKFLEMKLKDLRVNFWTSNGVWEADCLYNNYNIDLLNLSNVNCCTAYHLSIMRTLRALSKLGRALYPPQVQEMATKSRNLRLPSFECMVELWLDIDKAAIAYEPEQLCNLSVRPLNLTAINIIKKRCSLVLPMSRSLDFFTWKQNQVTSKRAFCRLVNIRNDKLRKSIIKTLENTSEPHIDPAHYDHLVGGHATV